MAVEIVQQCAVALFVVLFDLRDEAEALCQLREALFLGSLGKVLIHIRPFVVFACGGSGYRGRTGIYELLRIDDELRGAIVAKRPSGEINEIARRNGMIPLLEDGQSKVEQGEILLILIK